MARRSRRPAATAEARKAPPGSPPWFPAAQPQPFSWGYAAMPLWPGAPMRLPNGCPVRYPCAPQPLHQPPTAAALRYRDVVPVGGGGGCAVVPPGWNAEDGDDGSSGNSNRTESSSAAANPLRAAEQRGASGSGAEVPKPSPSSPPVPGAPPAWGRSFHRGTAATLPTTWSPPSSDKVPPTDTRAWRDSGASLGKARSEGMQNAAPDSYGSVSGTSSGGGGARDTTLLLGGSSQPYSVGDRTSSGDEERGVSRGQRAPPSSSSPLPFAPGPTSYAMPRPGWYAAGVPVRAPAMPGYFYAVPCGGSGGGSNSTDPHSHNGYVYYPCRWPTLSIASADGHVGGDAAGAWRAPAPMPSPPPPLMLSPTQTEALRGALGGEWTAPTRTASPERARPYDAHRDSLPDTIAATASASAAVTDGEAYRRSRVERYLHRRRQRLLHPRTSIRYKVRKRLADSRPRIRGRFARTVTAPAPPSSTV